MNRRTLITILAAVSGLAAQTISSRLIASVPFAFDFQGKPLAAGQYEIIRTSVPNTLIIRNLASGLTLRMMTESTSQSPGGGNGVLFEQTGGGYYFRAMVDASTALTYNVNRSRKQVEAARNAAVEKVYVAAR